MKKSLFHSQKVFIIILLILSLIAVSGYFYWQRHKTQDNFNVVTSLEQLIELPTEEPSLATITDIEKLKDQPFFQNAENGDKLLIYKNSQKAILYRPSKNKIIDFTLIDTSSVTNNNPVAIQESNIEEKEIELSPVRVALYNGTYVQGLTKIAEGQLLTQDGLTVVLRENTNKKEYEKTLVIDLSGKNKTIVNSLIPQVKGEIAQLPDGEKVPQEADVLVILGKNFTK